MGCFQQKVIKRWGSLLLLIMTLPIYGQVYNYKPINHFNTETNPANIASKKNKNVVALTRYGIPSSNHFSYNELQLSTYLNSLFLGVGLTAANTNLNDSIGYNHIGISAAYRNVIFDKVYVKLGATYKLVDINAPQGNFDYYTHPLDSTISEGITQNLNTSLSFSSPEDAYYLSFGMLNYQPNWLDNSGSSFPSYYFINVGDLAGVIGARRQELLSLTFVMKELPYTQTMLPSYYINLANRALLTRNAVLKYGSRVGYVDKQYYHFTPFVAIIRVLQGRKNTYMMAKFAVDLGYEQKTFNSQFNPVPQLSVQFKL